MIRVGQTRNLLRASSSLLEIWPRSAHHHPGQRRQSAARTGLTKVRSRSHVQTIRNSLQTERHPQKKVCLKNVPGSCAIREPLSGTSHMPESGGGRVERMEVPKDRSEVGSPPPFACPERIGGECCAHCPVRQAQETKGNAGYHRHRHFQRHARRSPPD